MHQYWALMMFVAEAILKLELRCYELEAHQGASDPREGLSPTETIDQP